MKSVHEQYCKPGFAWQNAKQTINRHNFSNCTGRCLLSHTPNVPIWLVFIDELSSPYKEVFLMGHAHQSALVTYIRPGSLQTGKVDRQEKCLTNQVSFAILLLRLFSKDMCISIHVVWLRRPSVARVIVIIVHFRLLIIAERNDESPGPRPNQHGSRIKSKKLKKLNLTFGFLNVYLWRGRGGLPKTFWKLNQWVDPSRLVSTSRRTTSGTWSILQNPDPPSLTIFVIVFR